MCPYFSLRSSVFARAGGRISERRKEDESVAPLPSPHVHRPNDCLIRYTDRRRRGTDLPRLPSMSLRSSVLCPQGPRFLIYPFLISHSDMLPRVLLLLAACPLYRPSPSISPPRLPFCIQISSSPFTPSFSYHLPYLRLPSRHSLQWNRNFGSATA